MRGRTLPFPRERGIVLDILRASKTVPSFPVERWIDLSAIESARKGLETRISWPALMARSWGLVSAKFPILRQCYITLPRKGLYEHPYSSVSISVHRREPGARADQLIFCRIIHPEAYTLVEIQQKLSKAQTGPIHEVFPEAQWLDRLPSTARRLFWFVLMRGLGRLRCKSIGTFTISSLAGQNAMNRRHPLIATTSLSFSKIDPWGRSLITIQCDHRVLDGFIATEALDALESTLQETILNELTMIQMQERVQAAA